MAGTFPRYRLYESDGVTLVYEFENVLSDAGVKSDPTNYVEHTSLRGQGSIISEGSEQAFDLVLEFVLIGEDYSALVDLMDEAKDDIVKFTPYILKVDQTDSSTEDYRVKRLSQIEWTLDFKKKRVNLQKGTITLRANCW